MDRIKTKKQFKVLIAVAAAALLIAVIVISVFASGGGTKEYDTHLEMAQKYLDELNYEQAIVELRMAIEIEPNDSEAYMILSEVYVAMGDYENAQAVLEEGYAATGDAELLAERDRIAAELQEQEQRALEQEQKEQAQHVQEFYDKFAEVYDLRMKVFGQGRGNFNRYLTYAEYERACGGLVEQLEQCLADLSEMKGMSEEEHCFYKAVIYQDLADTYLRMGKLEECLQVRTEWAAFCDRPDLVQDGNFGYNEEYTNGADCIFDKYGRVTNSTPGNQQITMSYEEAHSAPTHYTVLEPGELVEIDFIYDNEGRTLCEHYVATPENGEVQEFYDDYSYTGNNSYVITRRYISPVQDEIQFNEDYDEYGWEINP